MRVKAIDNKMTRSQVKVSSSSQMRDEREIMQVTYCACSAKVVSKRLETPTKKTPTAEAQIKKEKKIFFVFLFVSFFIVVVLREPFV